MKKLYLLPVLFLLLSLCGCSKDDEIICQKRVMTYNVHNCLGTDEVFDYKRIADIINQANPDLVALQELDSVTTRNNGIYSLAELAKFTGMHAVYCASIDYKGGKYGIGILSKEQPLSYHKTTIPGNSEKRSMLVVEYKDLYFCSTHWSLADSERMASVYVIQKNLSDKNKPVIIGGDFNASPYSAEMLAFKKYFNCLNEENKYTFPSENPQKTIDYLFAYNKTDYTFIKSGTTVMDEKIASDHCPLYVDVTILK